MELLMECNLLFRMLKEAVEAGIKVSTYDLNNTSSDAIIELESDKVFMKHVKDFHQKTVAIA